MREICFDTETTGFYPDNGDRIVEIGALELIDHVPTGKQFHEYINPERDVPEEVVNIHGLDNKFLADKPVFADIAQKWVDFAGDDSMLVAHNAPFDISFMNMELKRCGFPPYEWDRVIDTLAIAKKQFPGAHNKLDDLCKRFGIDNSARTLHGALLDAQLLSEVYLQLMGGAEPSINFMNMTQKSASAKTEDYGKVKIRERHFYLSDEELKAHRDFMEKNLKNPVWLSDEVHDAG